MNIYIYIHTYIYMYIYIYTHTHTHTHPHPHSHTHTHTPRNYRLSALQDVPADHPRNSRGWWAASKPTARRAADI